MKPNAKIGGSLHMLSDLAFRSVEIPLSRRLIGREAEPFGLDANMRSSGFLARRKCRV